MTLNSAYLENPNGMQASESGICRERFDPFLFSNDSLLHRSWRRGGDGALVDYLGLRAAVDGAKELAAGAFG
jgi:hypothetical protein